MYVSAHSLNVIALAASSRCRARSARLASIGSYAIVPLSPRIKRPRAGFLKAIQREGTEPHPARSAIKHVAQHPILRAFRRDAQIEPAAVSVHAGLVHPLDFDCREPLDLACHGKAFRLCGPQTCPQISAELRRSRANERSVLSCSVMPIWRAFSGLQRRKANDGELGWWWSRGDSNP
jgi:hypothetical protein